MGLIVARMKTIYNKFLLSSYIFSKLFFIVNFIETFPSEFPSILNLTKIMIKFTEKHISSNSMIRGGRKRT